MDFEAYPEHNQNLPVDIFDRLACRQRLSDDAKRLFSACKTDIGVIIRDGATKFVIYDPGIAGH